MEPYPLSCQDASPDCIRKQRQRRNRTIRTSATESRGHFCTALEKDICLSWKEGETMNGTGAGSAHFVLCN